MIDHEYLLSILAYNQETGVFTWKWRDDVANNINGRWCGREAGCIGINGRYKTISIQNQHYLQHKIAWFYVHKEWPERIDHRDGNGLNNRISNLRLATQSQNVANAYMLKRGVERRGNRYRAIIKVQGQRYRLGTFATEDEAQLAYNAAATKFFGEFARCNR